MNYPHASLPAVKRAASAARGAHLMMRYHAPLDDFDRHLARLPALCRRLSVGEVVFLVDPEEHFTGLPSLRRIEQWAAALQEAGRILWERGILMSINPWVTLGHGGRSVAPAGELALTTMMTGDDGAVSPDTACPADPAWRKYIAAAYAAFAAAAPEILWIEDDLRLHNHGPVRFGCFASPMLDEFSRRTGQPWTRTALVQAIVVGGEIRAQWLRFTGDLWNDIVGGIREAVHRVNPDVKLAQMTSTMAAHAVEGRRWRAFLSALSGPHKPITRPHFGPYRNTSGFEFAEGLVLFRHSLAFAGRATRCCAEIENWPHSYFSKSMRQTRLAFELAQFFGCADAAFNLFSLTGNDPADEPWVIRTLAQAQPRLDALAALNLQRRVERGVHLWTHEQAALHQRVPSAAPPRLSALQPAFDAWARIFTRMAVASTFETRGDLTAVCGDTIRAATDIEIWRLLRGGLLLDARAALALQEMGYGEFLGVRITPAEDTGARTPAAIERIVDFRFGPRTSGAMGCAMMGAKWDDCRIYEIELRGACAASRFESADHTSLGPAVTCYENSLGGRIAIFPYDFDSGVADSVRFFNHTRKQQIQAILRWLARGREIIASPDAALFCIERCAVDGQEILAVVNLNGDALCDITIDLPASPRGLSILDGDGRWASSSAAARPVDGGVQLVFPSPLESFEACFVKWSSSDVSKNNA